MRTLVAFGLILGIGVLPVGASTTVSAAGPPPVVGFTDVSAGRKHSCGILAGDVYCWGTNSSGLLGNPSVAAAWYPVPVDTAGTPLEGKTVTQISAGEYTSCAITSESALVCWGMGDTGQLGTGNKADALKPVAVLTAGTPLAGKLIAEVSMGDIHTCALTTDGVVACWGNRADGRLGTGTSAGVADKPEAVATTGTPLEGKSVAQISAGWASTCAVTTEGVPVCWGDNVFSKLGNGTANTDALQPVAVTTTGTSLAGKVVSEVEVGSMHACALTTDGLVSCWGSGSLLGNGSGTTSTVPVALNTTATPLAGKTVDDLTIGIGQTCATTTEGQVSCWGDNAYKQLGVTGPTGGRPVSVTVAGSPLAGKTIAAVSAGDRHTCAVTSDAIAACWGSSDYGQLGHNTSVTSYLPLRVELGTPGPPTVGGAVAGDRKITVSWTPPASTGGLPITDYIVRLTATGSGDQSTWGFGAGDTGAVIRYLPNGTSYTYAIAAVNPAGIGEYSPEQGPVTPTEPPSTVAPFASWDALVKRVHKDLINRQPTANELSLWTTQLGIDATKKGVLAQQLRDSADNVSHVDPTARLYRAFLGRAPDAAGLKFWVSRHRAGTWNLTRMANHFANSSEFKTKYGTLTNRQFVVRIYTDVLGRDEDVAGADYWTNKLDTKQKTRGQVMVGFSESSEYKRKQRENTDVAVAFIYLMGRVPTAGETAEWVVREKTAPDGTSAQDAAQNAAHDQMHAALLRELLNSADYAAHITG